jgi:hypothetical protein
MSPQLVLVHGIGRNETERLSYRSFARDLAERIADSAVHAVQWHDLGFSPNRAALADDEPARPLDPPLEVLLARPASAFLCDRLAFLLHVRLRDMRPEHPSWTVQTRVHQQELRLLDVVLDYIGDIELYLRDGTRRAAIRQRLRDSMLAAREHGPVTVISHSLGTLVAYDVLHQDIPAGAVSALVTLGSPLEVLLYLARGTGLATYNLRLHGALNWLNIYDIKDVIASKFVSGDFSREPRDDWLVRLRLSFSERDLVREGTDESVPLATFWKDRPPAGLRTNVGINREGTAFEAHANYWKHSAKINPVVVELIAGLVQHPGQ